MVQQLEPARPKNLDGAPSTKTNSLFLSWVEQLASGERLRPIDYCFSHAAPFDDSFPSPRVAEDRNRTLDKHTHRNTVCGCQVTRRALSPSNAVWDTRDSLPEASRGVTKNRPNRGQGVRDVLSYITHVRHGVRNLVRSWTAHLPPLGPSAVGRTISFGQQALSPNAEL